MAQKVTVALEDDLDGGPADETVRFARGGAVSEIDLRASNAAVFRRQFAPFITHTRRAGREPGRGPGRTVSSRERSADIRAWAKDQGVAVSERGRIPASVLLRTTKRPPNDPGRRWHAAGHTGLPRAISGPDGPAVACG
jgi:hypothetical protein